MHEALQAGCKAWKWADRSHMGIYLGLSPQHVHSVGLILSLKTGLVSPQFHLLFDDMIGKGEATLLPDSLWQEKTYFKAMTRRHTYEEGAIPHSNSKAVAQPTQGSPMGQPQTMLEQMHSNWEEINQEEVTKKSKTNR